MATMKKDSRPPEGDRLLGLEPVRAIALAWAAGEIATRDEAITLAAGAMLKARLTKVPKAALERAATEVARLALEDPTLRERVGRMLDRMAAEVKQK